MVRCQVAEVILRSLLQIGLKCLIVRHKLLKAHCRFGKSLGQRISLICSDQIFQRICSDKPLALIIALQHIIQICHIDIALARFEHHVVINILYHFIKVRHIYSNIKRTRRLLVNHILCIDLNEPLKRVNVALSWFFRFIGNLGIVGFCCSQAGIGRFQQFIHLLCAFKILVFDRGNCPYSEMLTLQIYQEHTACTRCIRVIVSIGKIVAIHRTGHAAVVAIFYTVEGIGKKTCSTVKCCGAQNYIGQAIRRI